MRLPYTLLFLLILALTAVTHTNATTTNTPNAGDVLINEINPNSSTEWVELYNTTASDLDISYHYIDDIANGGRSAKQIPAGTIIPAHGYYTMDFSSYFNNSGDEVRFLTPAQTLLDSYNYTHTTAEVSWFRYPDGQRWSGIASLTPTKGGSNPGTGDSPWQPGSFEIRIFDVEQGDSQLIIFPSGYTILIDVSEASHNTGKGAAFIATKVYAITGSTHINVGVLSHLHEDHIGNAGYGGFWALLEKESFTFDQIIDRDAGIWEDGRDGTAPDGICNPNTEITWHNAGDAAQTGTAPNWLCYATDPTNTKIHHPIRQLAQRGSTTQIAPPDDNAQVEIVQVDAAHVFKADGSTPLAGDHTADPQPPSENDYSITLKITYGQIDYVTGGDTGGEYSSIYSDVETVITPWIVGNGRIEILRVNHHGSRYSSNQTYINTLNPITALISCGNNAYGHPHQTVLDRLTAVSDVYLTNHCTTDTDYSNATILNDDIILRSIDNGVTYHLVTETQTPTSTSTPSPPTSTPPPPTSTPLTSTATPPMPTLTPLPTQTLTPTSVPNRLYLPTIITD